MSWFKVPESKRPVDQIILAVLCIEEELRVARRCLNGRSGGANADVMCVIIKVLVSL